MAEISNHPDLLSNLPLCIIHNILTFVPIREAVRTCVLSTQWRYTWVTLPNLVFQDKHFSDFRSKDKFEELMGIFITNVLLCHKGPIYKFQMSVSFSPSSETMDRWILCLSKNDIRELILDLKYDQYDRVRLPSSIYSCEKLTYLRLHNCELITPPSSFNGFLFLRGLHLQGVHLYPPSSDRIESVFANSPLLEKLDVIYTGSCKLWMNAPSLKYLFLRGDYTEMSLHAPHLAVMDIEILYIDDIKVGGGEDYECNYTNFLGRFTNLEKLKLNLESMLHVSWDMISSHRSVVFPRLKDIKLGVYFNRISIVLVAVKLVLGSPNLEKLEISCGHSMSVDNFPNPNSQKLSVMDFRSALDSPFGKLRVAKMTLVTGRLLEVEFIKYLLENSPVLEVMTIKLWYELTAEKIQILKEVLLSFTCASPFAKIIMTDSRY